MHASKYFAHFPLSFISSVGASEIAGWLSFPDARGVCSHCSRFWQHHWFLCASCTDSDRAHNLLRSSYHAWHHARRVEKDGKARGALGTTQGCCFFFSCSFAWINAKNPIKVGDRPSFKFMYVQYLWQRWRLIIMYDSVSPRLGTAICKIDAADKIRM